MPLTHSAQNPIADRNGDVYFAMLDSSGNTIPCEASRDYLIGLPSTDLHEPPAVVFERMRDVVELTASEEYDLHGPDEKGVVRLAPLIA